jgi:hypothetical protein
MLARTIAAVAALAALTTTTTAGTGLATGKRQYKPVTFSALQGAIPLGHVRFRVDSSPMAPISRTEAGRITGIAVDPSDPLAPRGPRFRARPTALHSGAANGGAWKTRDGGASWLPMQRDIVTTLRRGTVRPGAHIPTHVHVIRNGGGTMGLLRRAPLMRWR